MTMYRYAIRNRATGEIERGPMGSSDKDFIAGLILQTLRNLNDPKEITEYEHFVEEYEVDDLKENKENNNV